MLTGQNYLGVKKRTVAKLLDDGGEFNGFWRVPRVIQIGKGDKVMKIDQLANNINNLFYGEVRLRI